MQKIDEFTYIDLSKLTYAHYQNIPGAGVSRPTIFIRTDLKSPMIFDSVSFSKETLDALWKAIRDYQEKITSII